MSTSEHQQVRETTDARSNLEVLEESHQNDERQPTPSTVLDGNSLRNGPVGIN